MRLLDFILHLLAAGVIGGAAFGLYTLALRGEHGIIVALLAVIAWLAYFLIARARLKDRRGD